MVERTAAVVTVSDSVAAGINPDLSGDVAREMLADLGFTVTGGSVIPDGTESVATELIRLAEDVSLIVTTGGTGLSPRDLTPEGTRVAIDREIPGLPEAMRADTFGKVPFGMLSRGIAGLRGRCVIVNLPGSPKAVREGLTVIGPVLEHAVEIASGDFGDHR
ncbi:MAG: MogA/MoaB family molybdenum cofactor biosynthesis protein [Acidimicrobiia bacterium]|nr:MAG: MogA/MoaB family molybdenum cofactor biosynthesis protein [Acidimicrobiia bacterium]